jgi:hypothetical protein
LNEVKLIRERMFNINKLVKQRASHLSGDKENRLKYGFIFVFDIWDE